MERNYFPKAEMTSVHEIINYPLRNRGELDWYKKKLKEWRDVESSVKGIPKKSETKEGSEDKSYFRTERSWGKIERVISIPVEADPESAKAAFKNGVLTIEVNEKSQDKAHKKVSITSEA